MDYFGVAPEPSRCFGALRHAFVSDIAEAPWVGSLLLALDAVEAKKAGFFRFKRGWILGGCVRCMLLRQPSLYVSTVDLALLGELSQGRL